LLTFLFVQTRAVQEDWRIFDFLSHHPESCHMLTFLFHDVGIPQDYRHMPGFGVHTYIWLNKEGKETFVKYHWIPKAGTRNLLDDAAVTVGGSNASHATQDLYDTIGAGGSAEWQLCVQLMDAADEEKFDFDPLDVTKTWPEGQFPLRPVGRMVLNRNPDNFFTENEQVAFCPGVTVPGIHYSDDKLLQTRIFSYSDTQRHRLGPNYLLIPVNMPRCVYHNNHHEGFMNDVHRTEVCLSVSLWSGCGLTCGAGRELLPVALRQGPQRRPVPAAQARHPRRAHQGRDPQGEQLQAGWRALPVVAA
jgi:catalase